MVGEIFRVGQIHRIGLHYNDLCPMNENWPRWIFTSLAKHFDDAKGDIADYHVQGTIRRFNEDVERLEFRATGIDYDEQTDGQYRLSLTVGLLVTVPLDGANNYRIHQLTGRYVKAFESPVIVKKYGAGPDDDQSVLGCMQVKGDIKVHDWGQIAMDVKVTQSSVESDLFIDLQE